MFRYVPKELNQTLTEQKVSTKQFITSKQNQSVITLMNGKELESINLMCMCDNEANLHKETLGTYENEGKENTSSTSEKNEKSHYGYFIMYKYGKHFCH